MIRQEEASDIAAIRRITKAAFATAPHSSQTEAEIIDALRKAGALTLSLVSIEAGEITGHIAFSPVMIAGKDCGWYGLGPVSVKPDQQNEGIGSNLVREGLARLAAAGAKGCVVLGEPGYYSRFGFATDARLVLDGVPAEFFMQLAFDDDIPAGLVTYHEGFNAR